MFRRLTPRAALALFVVALYTLGAFEPLERSLLSARFRLTERASQASVVVVGIDPASLEALDVWPWDRGLHATVLENLLRAGAVRVGFDIDFSSRSTDPEQDRQLALAFASAGSERIVLPTFRQRDRNGGGPPETRPLPRFREHATLASINIRPDGDGVVRSYPGNGVFDGRPVPSFAAALAGNGGHQGKPFMLDFGIRPASVPQLSYLDVLTNHFDPAGVSGRAVIVGGTAVELGDTVAVPHWSAISGPVLQALAFEALTRNRALVRSPPWTVTLMAIVLAFACSVPLCSWSWRRGLMFVIGGWTLLFSLSWVLQSSGPFVVDTVPLCASLAGAYVVGLAQRVDRQGLSLLLQALRLRRAESMMQHVVDNSFDAILTLDRQAKIESFNLAARELFGARGEALIGRSIDELVPAWGSDAELGVRHPKETRGRGLGGAEFPLELSVVEVQDDTEGRRVCFLRDITERKTHEHALKHQATHDALTGLPNRVLLGDRVDQALREADRRSSPVAFLILDLDRFKEVNDTLGHHAGDLLLQQIPRRLTAPLRRSDTIARLGGDEFAVLLPGADIHDASEIANRLVATLAEPFKLYGVTLPIEASIGIAMYPEHGESSTELIQHADVAMYVAKRSRRDFAVYEPDKDFTSLRDLTLSSELHRAIKEDQLMLHFQPKIGCRTGEVVGVEALVRWEHPQHGLLPPSEFIGIAEQTGLIKPLSHWVMGTAIRQCANWRTLGRDIAVAVNLSARNLQEKGLANRLEQMLSGVELPPTLLTLEITESVLMEDWEESLQVLTAFANLGVRISIDDFGTGYSSLAYLKQLPAHELKIDKTFVSELDRNRENAVIVRSTIDMAHNLGFEVVAEGVENEAVMRRLQELGCDSAQGFHFSRPVSAEELVTWLGRRTARAQLA